MKKAKHDKWLTERAAVSAAMEGDQPAQASPPTGRPVLRLLISPGVLRDTNPYQRTKVPPRRAGTE
ncbi:MAG: hypothetical protein HYZ28_12835 [Myxococcales bacterium]|nr:hypothetical protein [Myxococcales bacterium]